MNKDKIIDTLNTIADLLEIKGENAFKCNAYRTAAHSLESYEGDVESLVKDGKLLELKGIGKSIAEKIVELYNTGETSLLSELKKEIPAGVLEMLKIPGFGPKKTKIVFDKIGIKSIGELEYACIENRLLELPGFGSKTQGKILNGIELYRKNLGKFLIETAHNAAMNVLKTIRSLPETMMAEVAGSLRRCKETVKDIDIVAASENPAPIMDSFASLPEIAELKAKGETKSAALLSVGISVDLRVVSPSQYASALNYFTGSKEHNVALRSRAIKMGMKLSEYGLFRCDGEKEMLIDCQTEEDIYKTLGLAYIPPELREDRGEIEAAEKNKLPNLISLEDIQGTFHFHTNFSDGALTLEQVAETAKSFGLKYLGIADHSRSAFYANGLNEDAVKRQWDSIDKINDSSKNFKIFKGIESDILKDGSLDYDEKLLAGFDFIIGSIHSHFTLPEEEMTKRVLAALENPYLSMLGHPTGRLLLARNGYAIDIDAIIEGAAKNNKIIEINSNPYRLDIDWRYCKKAIDKGVLLSINPDGHNKEGFSHLQFGVGIARKGWCEKKHIINTRTTDEVIMIFKHKK